jgi:hypothetical protein
LQDGASERLNVERVARIYKRDRKVTNFGNLDDETSSKI